MVPLSRPERLLVLAYGHGLGDSVLALPFLAGARAVWPGCRLTLATTAPTGEWFRSAGLADAFLELRPGGLWGRLQEARRGRFDLAVDLRLDHTVQSAVFSFLSGARRTAGFDCPLRGAWFGTRVPADYRNAHHAENLRRLAEALGIPWRETPPPVSAAARARAGDLLAGAGITGDRPLVALAPGGRDDLARVDKRWPADRFHALARVLQERGYSVVVVGASGEEDLAARATPPATANLAGKTSCEELAALFGRCALVVANNSGPLHLADALGTPTVSFSGGVHMTHWRPLSSRARVLLRDGNCRNDLCRTCPDKGARCLEGIGPERAVGAALAALAAGRDGGAP